jgi:hypothetical protein
MAITLSITLTDAEQAKLIQIADAIAPNMTGPQLKAWAEKQAKLGLRQTVQLKYNEFQQQSMETAWPTEPLVVPPQTP